MTRINEENTSKTPYRLKWATRSVIAPAIVCSNPEDVTAFPSTSPPAARMMMVQRKLLKSSFVKIPLPKKRTMGIMAITPMSPKTVSSWWLKHQRTIVMRVVRVTNHCVPVKLSLTGRMGTIVVPRPGLNVTRSIIQIARMQRMHTGIEMKNHVPQLIAGYMFSKAMMFCGDAIGEAAPPTFAAKAIPRMSAFEKLDSGGRLRNSG